MNDAATPEERVPAAPPEPADLPPLWRGEALRPGEDPVARAAALAAEDGEPGRLLWADDPALFRLAVTLAPETTLAEALPALPALALALADALGSLAPPETAVQFRWPGEIRVNGARAGRLRAVAPVSDPEARPAWLVLGVELALAADAATEPGLRPAETALAEEGAEIAPRALVETLARHVLAWVNRLVDDGPAPILRAWGPKLDGLADPAAGRLLGLDPLGGARVAREAGETTLPLAAVVEVP